MGIDSKATAELSFWQWLKHSGDNSNLGASARKLTIPPFVVFCGYLHYKYAGESPTHFLYADLCFILLLIGLLRTDQLMEFILKLKGKNETTPSTPTT